MAYEIIPIRINRVVIHPLYAAKNQGGCLVTAELVVSFVMGFPTPRTTSNAKNFAIRSPDGGNHVGAHLKN